MKKRPISVPFRGRPKTGGLPKVTQSKTTVIASQGAVKDIWTEMVTLRDRAKARKLLAQAPPPSPHPSQYDLAGLFSMKVLEEIARPFPAALEAHLEPWRDLERRERERMLALVRKFRFGRATVSADDTTGRNKKSRTVR